MGRDSRLNVPLYQNIDPARLANAEFSSDARSQKTISGILPMPFSVIPPATDLSTTATLVGKGNLLRVRVTALTYIAFGPSSMVVPTIATQNALELFSAGTYLMVATDDYVMASVNPARVEVLNGLK